MLTTDTPLVVWEGVKWSPMLEGRRLKRETCYGFQDYHWENQLQSRLLLKIFLPSRTRGGALKLKVSSASSGIRSFLCHRGYFLLNQWVQADCRFAWNLPKARYPDVAYGLRSVVIPLCSGCALLHMLLLLLRSGLRSISTYITNPTISDLRRPRFFCDCVLVERELYWAATPQNDENTTELYF